MPSGLPALNELTSYAYLLSHIPGVRDATPPLAGLAPLADGLPVNGLPSSNGLALPEGAVGIPSGAPLVGLGNVTGFPPPAVDALFSAGSPLTPLSTFLAPAEPTPTFAVLEPVSGFLLF